MTEESGLRSPGVVVGRQGIYDTGGSVIGYELLFRGGPPSAAPGDGGSDGGSAPSSTATRRPPRSSTAR